ncbi:sigma-70 family RNA polymerase sigma factor [Candidatus Amarolinea dominans]|uniref:RNA polymerase sigma factor n=1 Tax=Candidatus Amarolinea dominans TaxID=3140696 RepID=UPI003134CCDB|nr:sigma-70 family RNA polymerase sigma factor [Anaerolineae bacterium]
MTQPLPPLLVDRCHAAVRRILASRGWRLLDFDAVGITWDEFVRRVCHRVAELLAQGSSLPEDKLIERAVINQYCIVLHDALKTDDTLVMTQAYREIWAWLRPIAERKIGPELADDLTQQALFNIWHAFRSKPQPLTDPGAFLLWSIRVLEREIGQWYRRRVNQAENTVNPIIEDEDEDDVRFAAEFPALTYSDFWAIVRRCLSRPDEFAIILAVFRDDASIKDLADRIGRTPNWVSLKKFKALERLRECGELGAWFAGGAA